MIRQRDPGLGLRVDGIYNGLEVATFLGQPGLDAYRNLWIDGTFNNALDLQFTEAVTQHTV